MPLRHHSFLFEGLQKMQEEIAGKIIRVEDGSLAKELGLVPGDKILSVNGTQLHDIIELSFAFADEEIDLLIEHEDGEREILSFEKDYDEELGAEFESAVFDGIRRCANHCYFCFVDQVAPRMRDSLHIKDDDYRMSFLYGNFITMTNLGRADFKRIEQYHLSPLFISVQTVNPELRAQMLRSPRAAKIAEQLDSLQDAGISYHAQVVLCPGLNDGEELDRTIADLMERQPHAQSLAIVPVGLTKFREGCYPLRPFDKEGAIEVIEQVRPWQEKARRRIGRTFAYLGDEFYFLAGQPLPPADAYDGFPQLDNGIGLARNFLEDWKRACDEDEQIPAGDMPACRLLAISGTSIAPLLRQLAESLNLPHLHVEVIGAENQYFGTSVNVSGLLTGRDIMKNLQRAGDFDGILLPECALRSGENLFLDDMTLGELQEKFPSSRIVTVQGGKDFYRALAHWQDYCSTRGKETTYMWQSNAAYTKMDDFPEKGANYE